MQLDQTRPETDDDLPFDYPVPDREVRIEADQTRATLAACHLLEKRPVIQATIRAYPQLFEEGGIVTTWGKFVSKIATEAGCSLTTVEDTLLNHEDVFGFHIVRA
ncbi:MAG: hypothetical protein JXQ99_02885 [Hyphomicrobiaceae bacterium]